MKQSPLIVAIAGGSGSGKTSLAYGLSESLSASSTVISMDRYYVDLGYLQPEQRRNVNFDHPETLEMDLFFDTLLALRSGQSAFIPHYSYEDNTRLPESEALPVTEVVIIEGMHALLHIELRDMTDISFFIDIPENERYARKQKRDLAERGRTQKLVDDMWQRFTKPMHDLFVQPTRDYADHIFHTPGKEHSLAQTIRLVEKILRTRPSLPQQFVQHNSTRHGHIE